MTRDELEGWCRDEGLELSAEAWARLDRLMSLWRRYGRALNLVGSTEPEVLYEHVREALLGVRLVERLAQNMFICAPHASQVAALAALDCTAELEAHRAVYGENRRLMLEGLPKAGFSRIAPPDGAFYVYADVSDLTGDSRALAAEILEGAGVAVTPGLDFDPVRGARTLRFSYAGATPDIREGLARLRDFMIRRG